jgi:hypothetical protein
MNAIRRPSSFFLAVPLLMLAACGPSIDPAAQADIDRRVSALQQGSNAITAPTGFEPMPLGVGQWAQYKMVDDKGQPSFLTHKIVGEDGGAYWVEIVHESYSGKMVQRMLVGFGNRLDPSQIEIRAIKLRDVKGNVTEFPPQTISFLQSTYRSAVAGLVTRWQGLPQEATTVPAGRFDACFKARTEAQWGPWKSTSDGWAHPAVPLSGAVRTQGVDKPFTMELVAFGVGGAKSEF